MRRFALVAALAAALAVPAGAQQAPPAPDTATIPSDRQLRQLATYMSSDARAVEQQAAQLRVRADSVRAAAQRRITRDSIRALARPAATPPAPSPTPAPVPTTPTPAPPAAAVLAVDGFEGATPAGAFRWAGTPAASPDVARTGARSMKLTYSGSADPCADAWAEQRFDLGENLREVWVEYYVFLPAGGTAAGPRFVQRSPRCASSGDPDGVVSNNKFFALWDLNYSNVNTMFLLEYRRQDDRSSYIYNMWGGRGTAYVQQHNGTEGVGQWGGFLTDAMRGRWVQVRIHARLSDTKEARNGLVEVWFDGVRRINETGIALMSTDPAGNFFRNGYLMGWANSGFDVATSVYVDDFRVYRSAPGW